MRVSIEGAAPAQAHLAPARPQVNPRVLTDEGLFEGAAPAQAHVTLAGPQMTLLTVAEEGLLKGWHAYSDVEIMHVTLSVCSSHCSCACVAVVRYATLESGK